MKRTMFGLLIGCVALAGCSSKGGDTNAGGGSTATCSASGDTISLTSKDTAFDKNCLAAKADTAFTVELQNKDDFPHDLSILDKAGGTRKFDGQSQLANANAKVSYSVPAQPAGTYYFQCDIHPNMNGKFIVS